jgi:hypothetical protein
MFNGTVTLIKRSKTIHCGALIKMGKEVKLISVCNKVWHIKDRAQDGKTEEVTCKRCLKILAKADEDGKVML